jgi:plastocyanin
MQPKGKNKALTVIIIAIVALLVIILVVVALSKKDSDKSNDPTTATDDQNVVSIVDGEDNISGEELAEEIPEALVGAKSEVEGGSLISADNKVITREGEEVKNDVAPMSPEAPRQTKLIEKSELPDSVVKVNVSALGFDPAEIRVKANFPVTIALTSTDDSVHIFKFRDSILKAVIIGTSPGRTRAITFQAPEPGEYAFFCDVSGHTARGETGVMIVE